MQPVCAEVNVDTNVESPYRDCSDDCSFVDESLETAFFREEGGAHPSARNKRFGLVYVIARVRKSENAQFQRRSVMRRREFSIFALRFICFLQFVKITRYRDVHVLLRFVSALCSCALLRSSRSPLPMRVRGADTVSQSPV